MQVKIPAPEKYGEITSNGNGEKIFKPNWRAISIIFGIVIICLGLLTGAMAWVIDQTNVQADTTRQVVMLEQKTKIINRKVDTLTTKVAVEQAGHSAILEAILRKVDPENADTLINTTHRMKEALAKELNGEK